MTHKSTLDQGDQALDVALEGPFELEWVVREDPCLEAELNQLPGNTEELSSAVVNKVLDRIKDL